MFEIPGKYSGYSADSWFIFGTHAELVQKLCTRTLCFFIHEAHGLTDRFFGCTAKEQIILARELRNQIDKGNNYFALRVIVQHLDHRKNIISFMERRNQRINGKVTHGILR